MRLFSSLFILLSSAAAYGQSWSAFLDSSRAIDWTASGGFSVPNYTVNCSTQPSLTANDPSAAIANHTQIQNALASCDATHNVVNIPAGTYYVAGWIYGSQGKQVVRGVSPNSTTIRLTATNGCGFYEGVCMVSGTVFSPGFAAQLPPAGNSQCAWSGTDGTSGTYTQGSTSILLSSCGGTPPAAGSPILLDQANDLTDNSGDYICNSDATECAMESGTQTGRLISGVYHSQVQITTVQSTTNNGDGTYTLTISPGVYFNNIRTAQSPGAWWGTWVQNDGIENLTLDLGYSLAAPTVGTPTSGGSCTPGTHSVQYKYFFSNGQSLASSSSSQFTCVSSTGQTVPLTIPLGPTGATYRNIYITKAGDTGVHYLISSNTINDNTTTSYSFTIADSSFINDYPNDNPSVGMINCYQCWVKNIKELYANRAHILIWLSYQSVVRDSYFYEAQAFNSQSYGIEFELTSRTLIENNIFQQTTGPIVFGQGTGNVVGYNYTIDNMYNGSGMQANSYAHNAANNLNLWEGNNTSGIWCDDIHGSSTLGTLFRNMIIGWQSGKTVTTYPISLEGKCRAFNVVGNVLGQPSYHNIYESYATANNAGVNSGTAANTSIYALGWTGWTTTGWGLVGACGAPWAQAPPAGACDPLVRATLMRWGNYDTIAAGIKWDSTEASPGAAAYLNANFTSGYFGSLAHTLPASLYYSSKPSWWPATKAWPTVGPDVSSGNLGTCSGTYSGAQATTAGQCAGGTLTSAWGGLANSIPAQDCYLNVMGGPPDGSGSVLSFDANSCYVATAVSVRSGPTITSGTVIH